jgi:hypothetical protein
MTTRSMTWRSRTWARLFGRSEHLPRQLRGRAVPVEHEPGELVAPVRARQERLVEVEREVVGAHDRERPGVVPAAPHGVRDDPDGHPAPGEQQPRGAEIDADEESRDVVLVQEEAERGASSACRPTARDMRRTSLVMERVR